MTSTELSNMALRYIGIPSIDDIDSTSDPNAIECKAEYDNTRKFYLRLADPGFARKEAALALASGETSSIYTYVYAYPADCLVSRDIYNATGRSDKVIYQRGAHSSGNSSVILTDKVSAVLVYTIDITNLNAFPDDDILAMSYMLAMKLANSSILRDPQIEAVMEAKFRAAFDAAQVNNKKDQNFEFYSKRSFVAGTLTATDIANRALRHLGILPIDLITDITDDTAIQCNEEYAGALRFYLKQAAPGFSRKELTLVLAAGETSTEYDYVYDYPTDCLLATEIYNTTETDKIEFEVAAHSNGTDKVILTNTEDAILVYTQDITDLTQFGDDDITAISYLLASKIGLVVPKDLDIRIKLQLVARAEQSYVQALVIAMTHNKRDQHKALPEHDEYITARA